MDKVIYKYEFETEALTKIKMPIGAEILALQTQNNKPCLWILVDPAAEMQTRIFEIIGTGWTFNKTDNQKYIGTYQVQGGLFVYHLFEYER